MLLEVMVKKLRNRAYHHKVIAYVSIMAALVVLVLGVYAYFVAEGSEKINEKMSTTAAFRYYANSLRFATEEIGNIGSKMSNGIDASLGANGDTKEFRLELTELTRSVREKIRIMEGLDNEFSNFLEAVSSIKDGNGYQNLISASITKIVLIGTLLFLVQVLIGLYRYSIRLSTHYESLADLLELCGDKLTEESPVHLAAILSSAAIDFGKIPSNHIESLLKTAKETVVEVTSTNKKTS